MISKRNTTKLAEKQKAPDDKSLTHIDWLCNRIFLSQRFENLIKTSLYHKKTQQQNNEENKEH